MKSLTKLQQHQTKCLIIHPRGLKREAVIPHKRRQISCKLVGFKGAGLCSIPFGQNQPSSFVSMLSYANCAVSIVLNE